MLLCRHVAKSVTLMKAGLMCIVDKSEGIFLASGYLKYVG